MSHQQDLQKIAEGREAEIYAWQDGTVLRLLRNPHAEQQVTWEEAAMKAARASGVSVPAVGGVTMVQGRPGLIMERIDGPDMLTLIGKRPWTVFKVARISGELHAQLHGVSAPSQIPALREKLKQRIGSSRLVPRQLADFAVAALDELPDGDSICHGDFHHGNLIMTDGDPVLIDWTNVARGDPVADFARTDLMLRIGEPPPGSSPMLRALAPVGRKILLSGYLRSYRRQRPVDMALAARWEVPVAANRLVENIEGERATLLRMLEQRQAALTGHAAGS